MLWCGCALVLCFSAFFYGKSLAFWGVQKLATRFDHTAVIKAQDITFGRGGLKLKSVSALNCCMRSYTGMECVICVSYVLPSAMSIMLVGNVGVVVGVVRSLNGVN